MASTLEAREMQYLSVYDIVWINTTLAGRALPFDYVNLEEAMAAQYSYGVSTNVPARRRTSFKFSSLSGHSRSAMSVPHSWP